MRKSVITLMIWKISKMKVFIKLDKKLMEITTFLSKKIIIVLDQITAKILKLSITRQKLRKSIASII
jgi:hypothetical protein